MSSNPDYLPPMLERFVAEYLVDFNGVRAWRASHPKSKSYQAAATQAHQALKKPQIVKRVEAARRAFYKADEMAAEEALSVISRAARATMADFVNAKGTILTPHEWPAHLAVAVKKWEPGEKLELHDQVNAAKLMAQAGGKLGDGPPPVVFTLEMFLRDKPPVIADLEKP